MHSPINWIALRAAVERERRARARQRSAAPTTLPASDPTTLADRDVVAWIQTHFYIPETRGPLQLAPYQQIQADDHQGHHQLDQRGIKSGHLPDIFIGDDEQGVQ